MFSSVLVVCVGNICRSPVGERLLAKFSPDLRVESAGLGALVDHAADETARIVAKEHGLSLAGHSARQFTGALAAAFDVILVMEPGHKREIGRQAPQLGGRTMLFGHWSGVQEIPDPYRKSIEYHRSIYTMLENAAKSWSEKLGGTLNV